MLPPHAPRAQALIPLLGLIFISHVVGGCNLATADGLIGQLSEALNPPAPTKICSLYSRRDSMQTSLTAALQGCAAAATARNTYFSGNLTHLTNFAINFFSCPTGGAVTTTPTASPTTTIVTMTAAGGAVPGCNVTAAADCLGIVDQLFNAVFSGGAENSVVQASCRLSSNPNPIKACHALNTRNCSTARQVALNKTRDAAVGKLSSMAIVTCATTPTVTTCERDVERHVSIQNCAPNLFKQVFCYQPLNWTTLCINLDVEKAGDCARRTANGCQPLIATIDNILPTAKSKCTPTTVESTTTMEVTGRACTVATMSYLLVGASMAIAMAMHGQRQL